ncbi:hypothetical protein [Pedococcus sp. P5_B7]
MTHEPCVASTSADEVVAAAATGSPAGAGVSLFTAHAVPVATRDHDSAPFSMSTRITASIETVDNDRSVLSQAAGAFT